MVQEYFDLFAYVIPFIVVYAFYILLKRRQNSVNLLALQASISQGLTEPSSLHPVIDDIRCIGSGACVAACPEGNVIGLINGKARLINPSHCIGHGACQAACPLGAISLVFGSEKRGIDIPYIGPDFQTNVPGIYIAGELGGMGLIRNAVEQGRQAMGEIVKTLSSRADNMLDVLIVGAGPAGITASLAALEYQLNFVTIEQDSVGGTTANYPRGKIVMTAPAILPIVGKMQFTETRKEDLIHFWQKIIQKTGLKINQSERMTEIKAIDQGFLLTTDKAQYRTRKILLAIGRRGTPRKLNVKGEEKTKVVYKLIDPEQYRGQHVLIVGGGDSALEAALSIAEQADTTVSISYRGEAFDRAKQKNREKVMQAQKDKIIAVFLGSAVKEILEESVVINQGDEEITLKNEAVIICAGGILPSQFLKSLGIEVETKYGTR